LFLIEQIKSVSFLGRDLTGLDTPEAGPDAAIFFHGEQITIRQIVRFAPKSPSDAKFYMKNRQNASAKTGPPKLVGSDSRCVVVSVDACNSRASSSAPYLKIA